MNAAVADAARHMAMGLFSLALCAVLTGCGGGGGDLRPDGTGFEDAMQGADLAILGGADARNVPIVFVDRQRGTAKFNYRLQGQEYPERDLLGLCRALAENDPDAMVCIVPSGALTRDEVGLIEAKLRESGIRNIRNLSSQGYKR